MIHLIFQSICLMCSLYFTFNLVCSAWLCSSWISNPNCKEFKYTFTRLLVCVSISWGVFYFLVKL